MEQKQRSIRAAWCSTTSRSGDDDEDDDDDHDHDHDHDYDDGRTVGHFIRNGGSVSVTNGVVSLLRQDPRARPATRALRATS